jgi:Protein of unknown function (DUF2905)
MPIGKALLIFGLSIAAAGAALLWAPWLVNWFGRLPGDVRYERDGVSVQFPVVSMIIVSVILSALLNVFMRR